MNVGDLYKERESEKNKEKEIESERKKERKRHREIWRKGDVTSKKSPNVYKSCPEMISLEKLQILTPFQKLPKNVGDLGKLIIATGFEKLPKVE